MKILIRALSVALLVSIPLSAFCLGTNIVTRMPDVYQYEFKATDALKHFDLNKDNDEMGKFISDFMLGKEKEFQLMVGDEDRPQQAFNNNEIAAVERARMYINILAVIGVLAVLLVIAGLIVLKKYELDGEIRKDLKFGIMIYVALMAVYLVGFYVAVKTGHSVMDMLLYAPEEKDLLPGIVTEGLTKRIYLSAAGVSTIIMAILGYGVHKLTEPRRMFSRNY